MGINDVLSNAKANETEVESVEFEQALRAEMAKPDALQPTQNPAAQRGIDALNISSLNISKEEVFRKIEQADKDIESTNKFIAKAVHKLNELTTVKSAYATAAKVLETGEFNDKVIVPQYELTIKNETKSLWSEAEKAE